MVVWRKLQANTPQGTPWLLSEMLMLVLSFPATNHRCTVKHLLNKSKQGFLQIRLFWALMSIPSDFFLLLLPCIMLATGWIIFNWTLLSQLMQKSQCKNRIYKELKRGIETDRSHVCRRSQFHRQIQATSPEATFPTLCKKCWVLLRPLLIKQTDKNTGDVQELCSDHLSQCKSHNHKN